MNSGAGERVWTMVLSYQNKHKWELARSMSENHSLGKSCQLHTLLLSFLGGMAIFGSIWKETYKWKTYSSFTALRGTDLQQSKKGEQFCASSREQFTIFWSIQIGSSACVSSTFSTLSASRNVMNPNPLQKYSKQQKKMSVSVSWLTTQWDYCTC